MPVTSRRSFGSGAIPRNVTVDEAVRVAARAEPDATGWQFDALLVTFGKMDAEVDRVAAALTRVGVGRGDRVAIWLPNKLQWPSILFACARIGAIAVALNTRWTAGEAAYVLGHSTPKLLFTQGSFLKIDFGERIAEIRRELGSRARFDVIEIDGESLPGARPWKDFIDGSIREPRSSFAPVSSDPVLLQYTSGTTARPKGALVPHIQIINYGVELLMRLGVQPGEIVLNTQPLYHVGGSCAALPVPLTLGCQVVMPEYYTAEGVLSLIEQTRPVARSGSETMYIDEMNHPRFRQFDVSSLRAGWTGAPPVLFDRIRSDYPIPGLVNLYGATEGGSSCGAITEPVAVRRVTVGRPLTGCEIRIADLHDGTPLPPERVGEICYRGWNRMIGYFDDEERTATAIDRDGFLHSGDLGHLDRNGYLHYRGRIKEMIRPGGENVAAEEVEEFLLSHPAVRRAAVIAAPDLRMREVVMAIIETDGTSLSEAEVITFCKGRLSNFRTPKHVRFTPALPLNSTGRVVRQELRRIYVDGDPELSAIRLALEGAGRGVEIVAETR